MTKCLACGGEIETCSCKEIGEKQLRRHHNTHGRRQIESRNHEYVLKRLARELGVEYRGG